jgi:hypothetical protein
MATQDSAAAAPDLPSPPATDRRDPVGHRPAHLALGIVLIPGPGWYCASAVVCTAYPSLTYLPELSAAARVSVMRVLRICDSLATRCGISVG